MALCPEYAPKSCEPCDLLGLAFALATQTGAKQCQTHQFMFPLLAAIWLHLYTFTFWESCSKGTLVDLEAGGAASMGKHYNTTASQLTQKMSRQAPEEHAVAGINLPIQRVAFLAFLHLP